MSNKQVEFMMPVCVTLEFNQHTTLQLMAFYRRRAGVKASVSGMIRTAINEYLERNADEANSAIATFNEIAKKARCDDCK